MRSAALALAALLVVSGTPARAAAPSSGESPPVMARRALAGWPARAGAWCKPSAILVRAHVDTAGAVDSARVEVRYPAALCLEPALAAALDSVAAAATRACRFAPARSRGRAVAGWCLVPWGFPAATPDSAAYVFGRVLDPASGAPIPYANVVILETRIGATADLAGRFVIAPAPLGDRIVQVLGYCRVPASGSVRLTPGGADTLTLRPARRARCGDER